MITFKFLADALTLEHYYQYMRERGCYWTRTRWFAEGVEIVRQIETREDDSEQYCDREPQS